MGRRTDPRAAMIDAFRNSHQWQRVRAVKRASHPLCEDCEAAGVTRVADDVDHVLSLWDRFDLRSTLSNLRSLCRPHHNAKTQAETRARHGKGATA